MAYTSRRQQLRAFLRELRRGIWPLTDDRRVARTINVAIAFVLAFLAFLMGMFVPYIGQIKPDAEVNISDLLSVIGSIVTALIIGYYIQNRSGNQRIEKNLLMDDVKEILISFRGVRKRFNQCYENRSLDADDSHALNEGMRTMAIAMQDLEAMFQDCKIHSPLLSSIRADRIAYKRVISEKLFTNQPYSAKEHSQETIYGNQLSLRLRLMINQVNRA